MLINLLVFDMDPQDAVDAPRFRHLSGQRVAIEPGVNPEVLETLETLGHELVDPDPVAFGGAQLVWRLDRGWAAASDPRKDGHAAGY
jgi:gamma-glutamyltranspeptidase/glutathione hydrolase